MKTLLNNLGRWSTEKKLLLIGAASIIAAANAFVVWYVLTEKTVHYWDYSGYWTSAVDLTNAFAVDLRTGVRVFLDSLSTDYNFLPALPIAFVMQFFGTDRIVYILSILNLYLIPFGFITAYLASRWFYKSIRTAFFLLVAAVTIVLPASLNPLIEGLPDVIGLLILSAIVLLFTRLDIFSRFDKRVLLLGIVLAFFIVVRRWYAFWVVGALAGLLIAGCYYLWSATGRRMDRRFFTSLYWPLLNLLVVGLVTLLVIVWLFPYTLSSFGVDYSDLYSAYSGGGIGHSVWALLIYFGAIVLVTSLVGYGMAFFQKKHYHRRPAALFFVVCTVVIFFLFSRTQDFGPHHYYLLVPGILFGLLFVIDWLVSLKRKYIAIMVASIWLVILPLSTFILTPSGTIAYVRTYLLGNSNPPVVRTDISELRALADYIDDFPTYVVASSGTFNDSVLRNVNLPGPYVKNVLPSSHIDKRDGFPNIFFTAHYVIVASPVQTHMPNNGQGQMVVTQLANSILNGEVHNLRYIKSYTIEGGLELKVYERVGEYEETFISSLKEAFSREYGGYNQLTRIGKEYL